MQKEEYIIGIDQSTQGTKALIFNNKGEILGRHDEKHKQYISEQGWVSHDPDEIYDNVILACSKVIDKCGIDTGKIKCIGISNQRETTLAWDKKTGKVFEKAIVWQCNRAEKVCEEIAKCCNPDKDIYQVTGIKLNPYYPASKMAWLILNVPGVKEAIERDTLALGTIDSWLVYKMTGEIGRASCRERV